MSVKQEKQYGLIIPKKQQLVTPKATNIFGDDDGSDEEDDVDWVRKALKAESEKNKKKQTKLSVQRALTEDPTVFQYDEVYDELERNKNQVKTEKVKEKKPLYIQNLLKAAERRKKEQEHRIERMVQKEREAEGEMYADKESFVTSAYRAKLEEFKKMEEEEARMERLESIGDVTKQQDMSGFYRQLYKQTVDYGDQFKDNSNQEQIETKIGEEEKILPMKVKKNRQYRQRVIDTYENDSDVEKKEEQKKEKEISVKESMINDQNTDNHISTKDNSEVEPVRKKQKHDSEEVKHQVDDSNKVSDLITQEVKDDTNITASRLQETNNDLTNTEKENQDNTKIMKLEEIRKERSSIWIKRTVGPVFEAALQRYYARKAARYRTIAT